MIGTLAVFGIVGCYLYSLYRVAKGEMLAAPDEDSGAPEGSPPQLVSSSSQD